MQTHIETTIKQMKSVGKRMAAEPHNREIGKRTLAGLRTYLKHCIKYSKPAEFSANK